VSIDTNIKTEIIIDFGQLRPMIDWLERNCVGEWGYNCVIPAGRDAGLYEFYFASDKDLVAFRIWKQ
jgi:hypothetical protein